jgi:hypothetical protein
MKENILEGGDSDDVLAGLGGADMLDGGGGEDTVSYVLSDDGVLINLVTNNNFFGHAAGDTLRGVENVTGSKYDDEITADGMDNEINGWDGDDTLSGGGGQDDLNGGEDSPARRLNCARLSSPASRAARALACSFVSTPIGRATSYLPMPASAAARGSCRSN